MNPGLDKAQAHVIRGVQLIEAQKARVRDCEQRGLNAGVAQALLQTMNRSLLLMQEHCDRLEEEAGLRIARHNNLAWPLAEKHFLRPRGLR